MKIKVYSTILTLFITCISFAQSDLYVANNANIYVYVTGDYYVYVQDDINLAGPDGRIYLRDEAQLLQDNEIIRNSGTGELSVFQDGTVNEYAYNFWCSPVGSKVASATNNPFGISLFNDITGLTTSTPAGTVHNASYTGTTAPLNIEPNWIWKFIASDEYIEWIFAGATTTINPGEGFTMKGTAGISANNPGSNQNYDFRGKPNTGTMTTAVMAPIATVPQWTLIGNPYASALDAYALIYDSDNINYAGVLPDPDNTDDLITGVLYYWEQAPGAASHFIEDYRGGYASFTIDPLGVESHVKATYWGYLNDGTAVFAGGGLGSKQPRRYIPIGQGFVVEGRNNGVVTVKNSHRVYFRESDVSGDSFFFEANEVNASINGFVESQSNIEIGTSEINDEGTFRSTYNDIGNNIVPEGYKRFRLVVDFEGPYTRELLHNFHASATDGFDYGLEAKSPQILASDAYWILNEDKYVIQAHNYDENLIIQLHLEIANQQTIRFRIFDVQRFAQEQPIFLHDIENDLYVDLKTQGYQLTLEPGTYKDRFEITFSNQETLDNPDVTISDLNIFQDNNSEELKVLNPNNLLIQQVRLFDVTGKLIFKSENLEIESEYHFSTRNLSDGVYVAALTIADQSPINKKVIIKNK